jgi:hydrogenase maturation protein HypF
MKRIGTQPLPSDKNYSEQQERRSSTSTLERRRLLIRGIVQGVGFRPFVYHQALQRDIVGFVLNDSNGVTIEIEGPQQALDSFQQALQTQAPPLARIDSIQFAALPPIHEGVFRIVQSKAGEQRHALISPDITTCNDCLHELFDPTDRRYDYPFINCTNCGPRFTIIQDVPYDRPKTTMSVFPLCQACQHEYHDPLNRRFHAQPNACPTCGPRIDFHAWSTASESSFTRNSPTSNMQEMAQAASSLATGHILAIKGLGGYHLACDAFNTQAVRLLRQRKHRESRPFALMVPDLTTVLHLCEINEQEVALLQARQRPIVLLKKRIDCQIAPDVAPVEQTLGIMLPYTPLHHLLFQACRETYGKDRPIVLVMTSGNLSDEPIAYQDADASTRLAPIADGMLTHNRSIHIRCDDSVTRVTSAGQQFLRRSRGYVPEPIALPLDCPQPLLACGAHLKNTFCLVRGRQAFISHHIGDLENLETLLSFREGIEHFQRLFDIHPEAIVYDLHPEYLATRYALDSPVPLKIGVQHHHAHIASVMAEHGLTQPVIGISADGTGYGTDGAIWGCEIMSADLLSFERLAHLAYVPLPGSEQAVRQPWRTAAVYLANTYGGTIPDGDIPFMRQLDRAKWSVLSQMIAKGINSPQTSSLGRLFDAVAALLGLRGEVLYEGQAAIELEIQAVTCMDHVKSYPFSFADREPIIMNVVPAIEAIVRDIEQGITVAHIAKRFHLTIAEMLAQACLEVHKQTGLDTVALSGGVFQNQLLLEQLVTLLKSMAFHVYINQKVPPNDGGLSLGQAAIGAARLHKA